MENNLEYALRNMRIALENAREQTEIALQELIKLKAGNEADEYMAKLDAILKEIGGEK